MRATELKVGMSVTVNINGVYFKPNAELKLNLDLSDDREKRLKAYSVAFDEVSTQIEKQIVKIAENNK